jgi:uncharacterized membrane protein YoaK (UPF0700 family)
MTHNNTDTISNRALPIFLALIAGYLDGYGLRFLGAYVSFMSGNTTIAGMQSGAGMFHAALPSAVAIAFFVTGSVFGNLMIGSRLRQSHRLVFGLIAGLIFAAAVLEQSSGANALIEIGLVSMGMGLMNPAVSKLGPEPVSLTFVTGTLNRMGGHLAAALALPPLPASTSSRRSHLLRAGIDASMWSGFLLGAVLSGLVGASLRKWALWPACLAIAAVGAFGRCAAPTDGQTASSNK